MTQTNKGRVQIVGRCKTGAKRIPQLGSGMRHGQAKGGARGLLAGSWGMACPKGSRMSKGNEVSLGKLQGGRLQLPTSPPGETLNNTRSRGDRRRYLMEKGDNAIVQE